MDHYRIDSHKLNHPAHRKRVEAWVSGRATAPIYVEISPTSRCNHRCAFCPFNEYRGHGNHDLDTQYLGKTLEEMAHAGVKSVMYSGEGEPFLHKDFLGIITKTRSVGIDVGITTNGVLFRNPEPVLRSAEWVKVSLNAGKSKTYGKVHGCMFTEFFCVIENLAAAVAMRDREGYACTLGVQMVVLPEHLLEVPLLAKTVRDTGADYLIVKPFVRHEDSGARERSGFSEYEAAKSRALAKTYETNRFRVIWRDNMIARGKPAKKCLALPFWAYIDSLGDVWNCKFHLNDERFKYGNIYKQGFGSIWANPQAMRMYDREGCTENCRMANVNKYLEEIQEAKDPWAAIDRLESKGEVQHVNFI